MRGNEYVVTLNCWYWKWFFTHWVLDIQNCLPDGVADARILQGLKGRLDKYLKVISTWGLQNRQVTIGSGNLLS